MLKSGFLASLESRTMMKHDQEALTGLLASVTVSREAQGQSERSESPGLVPSVRGGGSDQPKKLKIYNPKKGNFQAPYRKALRLVEECRLKTVRPSIPIESRDSPRERSEHELRVWKQVAGSKHMQSRPRQGGRDRARRTSSSRGERHKVRGVCWVFGSWLCLAVR